MRTTEAPWGREGLGEGMGWGGVQRWGSGKVGRGEWDEAEVN
jgi:hypothetical protein